MIDSPVIAEYVEQARAAALAQGQLLGRQEGQLLGRREGLEEGRLDGLRQGILAVLEARFGPVPATLASKVGRLTEVAAATAWHRRAAVVTSLDVFAQELAAVRLGPA